MWEIVIKEEGEEIFKETYEEKSQCEEALANIIDDEIFVRLPNLKVRKDGKEVNYKIIVEIED